MKLNIILCLHLFSLYTFISANIDQELRKSIQKVMKCQYREPPKGPVMAVSPKRFAQIVVVLHERFHTPACFKTSQSIVNLADERTWPVCVFGKCYQGRCQCAGHYSGPKCSRYTKKCWLMYCFLTSCHPAHQSLHCICDPKLYGTKIISEIYWYDEGKSSKYLPPPAGWQDEPAGMLNLKSDSAIEMGASDRNQNAFNGPSAQNNGPGKHRNQGLLSGSPTEQRKGHQKVSNGPYVEKSSQGENLNQGLPTDLQTGQKQSHQNVFNGPSAQNYAQGKHISQDSSSFSQIEQKQGHQNVFNRPSDQNDAHGKNRNQDSSSSSQTEQKPSRPNAVESMAGFDSVGRANGLSGHKNKNRGNALGGTTSERKATDKTDVEEALDELEEASLASKLESYNFYTIVLLTLSLSWLHRR